MRFVALISVLAVALSSAVYAGDKEDMPVFHDKGYLVAQSEDGLTKYWVDGRIMLDYGSISSDNNLPSGFETRRARFAVKSIFQGVWAGELDMDIADNEIEIKDFWMAYTGFENTIVKIGNHKVPSSMEEMTTSRWLTFMERSLINAFPIGRRIGLSYNHWGENYLVMGGFYGEEPGKGEESGNDETTGFGLRGAYAPIRYDDTVLHIGASYNNFEPEADSDDRVRFRGRELHLMDRLVNTGNVKNVDDFELTGIEFAGQRGAWSFQSEYMMADLNRYGGKEDASFDGFYAFVSWFPFGAVRSYDMDSAEFGSIHPEGKKGALELALRYSTLNLNDFAAGVEGGEASNITFGVNWYANDHVRIMFNYIMQDNDEYADNDEDLMGNDDLDIIGLRFQLLF